MGGVIITITSEKELVEERIERYLEDSEVGLEFGSSEDEDEEKSSAFSDWINGMVASTDFGEGISQNLARADLKFKPGEYIGFMGLSSILTAAISFALLGKLEVTALGLSFALAGAIFGLFIPRMLVGQLQKRRLSAFNDQLPDMLNLMVNGLRAGISTKQAKESVSKELPPHIHTEFHRVVQEMQLGISMDIALDNLLVRIPSEDLDLVITAINVQREVGGNLSEILETISHTIRERIRIKGEIKTLTTQVTASGRLLSIMPLFLIGALYVLNRDYIMQFFQEPIWCGASMLGCSGILIIAGTLVMNKISDIEV
ncbi:MAG: type II secretion system F family protein [Anaerolineales bacterium]